MALSIRRELFGEENVITAITHEDIAYAVYVRDYSQGDFATARYNILMLWSRVLSVTELLDNYCEMECLVNWLTKSIFMNHMQFSKFFGFLKLVV